MYKSFSSNLTLIQYICYRCSAYYQTTSRLKSNTLSNKTHHIPPSIRLKPKQRNKTRKNLTMVQPPDDGSTICSLCGVVVARGELKRHERTHRRACAGVCCVCGFVAKNIYQHMVTHKEERRFECQTCGLAFKLNKNLTVHMLVHEPIGKFQCDHCPKRFKTAYNLKVHRRSHEIVKPYVCQYCTKTFTTKQSRNYHEKCHIRRTI